MSQQSGHSKADQQNAFKQEDLDHLSAIVRRDARAGGIPNHEVDDIVQESCIVVNRKFNAEYAEKANSTDTYAGRRFSSKHAAQFAKFARWCAKKIMLNWRKTTSRRREVHFDPECCGVSAPLSIDNLDLMDEAACVRRRLTEEEQELFDLLCQGDSPIDICERLKISQWACYKRCERLKERIRELIDDD